LHLRRLNALKGKTPWKQSLAPHSTQPARDRFCLVFAILPAWIGKSGRAARTPVATGQAGKACIDRDWQKRPRQRDQEW